MKKAKAIITIAGVTLLLFSSVEGNTASAQTTSKSAQTTTKSTKTTSKTTQTKPKSTQTKSKSTQNSSKSEPVKKPEDSGTVTIGTQAWAIANLNVSTFRNGDSIPEVRTNEDWVKAGDAGKPAWCYYNNDPANGKKYGKLYNWYAVNDPRELAPAGWALSGDEDWAKLTGYLGGQSVAGTKMKTTSGWSEGDNGTNETGFGAIPGGYRIENGLFLNSGGIATWWTSTESKASSAIDHYITKGGSLSKSSTPKQRGESVRCLRK